MAGAGIVKFGDWISNGWALFQTQWQSWSLLGFLYFLAIMIIILVPYFGLIFGMLAAIEGGASETSTGFIAIAVLFIWIVGMLVGLSYLMAGLYKAAFKHLDGETISVSDLFSGGHYTFRVLGATMMIGLLTIAGALLCFFPAFIVAGLTYFTIPLIVRKDIGPMEALRQSYEFTKPDWLMFTLFALVVSLIAQVGTYLCYVGLIFTLPLMFTMTVTAYRDCFEGGTPATPTSTGETKSCPTCGAAVPKESSFCANCGASQI